MTRRAGRGFTLIEILVAMVILAVMGVMAYRGVTEARIAAGYAGGHMDRLREVQRGVSLLVSDFRTLAPRPVREPIGDGYRPALLRDPNSTTLVELTHGGWPNGAGLPRGTIQRVSYALEDGALVRRYWTVTDPTLGEPPVSRKLVSDVTSIEFRYLDSGREWVTQWPPLGSPGDTGFRARPLAVEIVLVLADYGEIRRLVEVAG